MLGGQGLAAHIVVNVTASAGIATVLAQQLRRRRAAERVVVSQSRLDALTGLASRHALLEHVNKVMRTPAPAAPLLLDVESFRDINDTFGDLLRQADLAAERARTNTRAIATVSHVPPRRSPDHLALLAKVRMALEGKWVRLTRSSHTSSRSWTSPVAGSSAPRHWSAGDIRCAVWSHLGRSCHSSNARP